MIRRQKIAESPGSYLTGRCVAEGVPVAPTRISLEKAPDIDYFIIGICYFIYSTAYKCVFEMNRIYALHENSVWVAPLREAFDQAALPYREWFLDQGILTFDRAPPQGVRDSSIAS